MLYLIPMSRNKAIIRSISQAPSDDFRPSTLNLFLPISARKFAHVYSVDRDDYLTVTTCDLLHRELSGIFDMIHLKQR